MDRRGAIVQLVAVLAYAAIVVALLEHDTLTRWWERHQERRAHADWVRRQEAHTVWDAMQIVEGDR